MTCCRKSGNQECFVTVWMQEQYHVWETTSSTAAAHWEYT